MTNKNLISSFIRGEKSKAKNGHLGYIDGYLVNYSTVICVIDREKRTALVNSHKYSTTTSKIMTEVRYQLHINGYEFEEFDGYTQSGWVWNYGFCGAFDVAYSDVLEAIETYKRAKGVK